MLLTILIFFLLVFELLLVSYVRLVCASEVFSGTNIATPLQLPSPVLLGARPILTGPTPVPDPKALYFSC